MHLFTDYLQPLINWLHFNPHWAIFITFIISFTESLAVIGTIIPGSVTMTAIGILAGSGVMRIDLTLIAATLGAIAGDSASYLLGLYFSERIFLIWPFSRYPQWLTYGKNYFERHGGKSVLIGRFVGPLRSIIPLIAGMMHMPQWRFFLANAISAVGWAIVYVVPGIILGAASNDLSAENASRFFVAVIFALIILWLFTLSIKWLLIRVHRILTSNLHQFWLWSKKHPRLSKYFLYFTPAQETQHYPTALLAILMVITSIFSLVFVLLVSQKTGIVQINYPVYLFLQSLRTPEFDPIFLFFSQLVSLPSLTVVFIMTLLILLYQKNYRGMYYITGLVLSTLLIVKLLSFLLFHPRPLGILVSIPGSSFPDNKLAIATALYGFVSFLVPDRILKISFPIFLFCSGFAGLYLGDYWLSDILAALGIGFSICLLYWLFYRRQGRALSFPSKVFLVIFLVSSFLTFWINSPYLIHSHTPYQKQFILSEEQWWNQKLPILPLYRHNRIGHSINLLNIQYVGSLYSLRQALQEYGWKQNQDALFARLLNQMTAQTRKQALPLLNQLHNNHRPVLIMTYFDPSCHCLFVLRLWPSNYHLKRLNQPIWIGSVHVHKQKLIQDSPIILSEPVKHPLLRVKPALANFRVRELAYTNYSIKHLAWPVNRSILLIRNLPPLDIP